MSATPEQVAAGHAFYTKRSLAIYDPLILGWFSRTAWKCPKARILRHYDEHVSANHLDVGVGTGYFLDHCDFGSLTPRLGLLDLSADCLDEASRRLIRYGPQRYTANVLEPIAIDTTPFDSIGLNYLLHCVPGSIRDKAVVFRHLKAMTNPGATVFGATLLHGGVERNWLARQVMARNNRVGIFHNEDDDLDGLRWAVEQHLADPVIEVVGCVGLFAGRT